MWTHTTMHGRGVDDISTHIAIQLLQSSFASVTSPRPLAMPIRGMTKVIVAAECDGGHSLRQTRLCCPYCPPGKAPAVYTCAAPHEGDLQLLPAHVQGSKGPRFRFGNPLG